MYIYANPKFNTLQVSECGKWPSVFEIPLNFGPWLIDVDHISEITDSNFKNLKEHQLL